MMMRVNRSGKVGPVGTTWFHQNMMSSAVNGSPSE